MLTAGLTLLLNKRRWQVREVEPGPAPTIALEVIGGSEAAQGMTRRLIAVQYGADLFIEQRPNRYWYGHLKKNLIEDDLGPTLQCRPATGLELLAAHTQHPPGGDLQNEFSWSYTRASKYQQCPRAYYYHYYAAWQGWRDDVPHPIKQVYLLKNLTDLPRWTGALVHETIKFALSRLKAGQPLTNDDLIKQMHVRAQADFTGSQSGRYRQQPNQFIGFQEHFYQADLPQTRWQTAWRQAEQYVTTFLNSALYARLRQQPTASFPNIEALQAFNMGQTRVWVNMDFAHLETDALYIYDWKTGTVGDEVSLSWQLGIYGLYFKYAQPELLAGRRLRGGIYVLAEDRLIEFDLDETMLQEMEAKIEASIAQLKNVLLDPGGNIAAMSQFPMIDALHICAHCQFRALCGRTS